MIGEFVVRDVVDGDADELARLVGGVFAEYPGCVLDLGGVDADLTAMRSTIDRLGGQFWVVEAPDAGIVGCCGYAPTNDSGAPTVELKRLYVDARVRGRGLGAWLVGLVEGAARGRDAAAIELWSDTRFRDAHRLYERLGFARCPETRELNDPSDSVEYRYVKRLAS